MEENSSNIGSEKLRDKLHHLLNLAQQQTERILRGNLAAASVGERKEYGQ